MLDSATLRVAFAVTALTLLLLFGATYRSTRSSFSLGWTAGLGLFLGGSAAYLFDGTPQQVWANPLGNGLFVAGAASIWVASRSLRGRPSPPAIVLVPPLVMIAVSAFDSPATNDWSGGPLYLLLMGGLIACSAREMLLLDPAYSRMRRPLFLASAALAVYYLVRCVVFVAVGRDGALFVQYFGTPSTTLITLVLLVVVSYSMASLSGEQRARELTARVARSGREIAEAAGVQQRLLPRKAPVLPGYEIAGACVPSGSVSGDFFDWQPTRDGLAVTVADVMGKGVGAAMIAATVRAAMRVATPAELPGRTMAVVDRILEADLAANEAFVTLMHLRLDATCGDIEIVDAGHGLGVVSRADGSREVLVSRNLPLGVLGTQEWRAGALRLEEGDLLLIFSDGVLDLFDGTLAAMDRAVDLAREAAPTALDAVEAIARLAVEGPVPDDVTVVAIRRTA